MESIDNMESTEAYLYIKRELKEFKLAVRDLLNTSKELLARNEELEKENEKLRKIIHEMSQEK